MPPSSIPSFSSFLQAGAVVAKLAPAAAVSFLLLSASSKQQPQGVSPSRFSLLLSLVLIEWQEVKTRVV